MSPFAELSNAILTPHIGATTVDAQRQIGEQIVRIIDEASSDPDATSPLDTQPAVRA